MVRERREYDGEDKMRDELAREKGRKKGEGAGEGKMIGGTFRLEIIYSLFYFFPS